MMEINTWMNEFLAALEAAFGSRVLFVGLQGSYGRGEATEASDIDTVVILDRLSAGDIAAYGKMLDTLTHRSLACGFLAGKSEISAWEPSDLFQFYHDTKAIKGSLDFLLPLLDKEAVKRAVKIGACNVFHGCIHNMLYEKSEDILRGLYKAASFTVQAIYFSETGKYVSRMRELIPLLSSDEKYIAETFISLKNGGEVHFTEMSERLFEWAQKRIK
jgi:predicted nucleotidyltransferase